MYKGDKISIKRLFNQVQFTQSVVNELTLACTKDCDCMESNYSGSKNILQPAQLQKLKIFVNFMGTLPCRGVTCV